MSEDKDQRLASRAAARGHRCLSAAPSASRAHALVARFLDALFGIADPGHIMQLTSWWPQQFREQVLANRFTGRLDKPCPLNGGPETFLEVIAWAHQQCVEAPGLAVYFAPAPRAEPRRTGDASPFFVALIADRDLRDTPESRKRFADGAASMNLLSRVGLPPSATISSGRGLHHYWFLEKPEAAHFSSEGQPPQARVLMSKLQRAVGSDPVHDPARLMRLPGSLNPKTSPLALVQVLELEPSRRYSLDQVESALRETGLDDGRVAGSLRPIRLGGLGGGGSGLCPGRQAATKASPSRPAKTFKRMVQALPPLSPSITKLVEGGWFEGCGLKSQSEVDLLVAGALLRRGVEREVVARVLVDRDVTRAQQKGAAYFDSTLELGAGPKANAFRCAARIGLSKCDAKRDWVRLRLLSGEREGEQVDARCFTDNERYPEWIDSLRRACGEPIRSVASVEDLRGRDLVVDVEEAANGLELVAFVSAQPVALLSAATTATNQPTKRRRT